MGTDNTESTDRIEAGSLLHGRHIAQETEKLIL